LFGLAAVAIALLLDVGSLALRGAMLAELPATTDTQASVTSAVYVATVAASVVVPLAQLLGILLLRRFALRT
jgi:hypothetical protein